jgi:histone H2B
LAGKSAGKEGSEKKGKKKAKKSVETYKIYIFKVLKQCTQTSASRPRPCPS